MQTTQIALIPMILQAIRKMDKEEFLLGPIKCYVVSILRLLRERDECVRERGACKFNDNRRAFRYFLIFPSVS